MNPSEEETFYSTLLWPKPKRFMLDHSHIMKRYIIAFGTIGHQGGISLVLMFFMKLTCDVKIIL